MLHMVRILNIYLSSEQAYATARNPHQNVVKTIGSTNANSFKNSYLRVNMNVVDGIAKNNNV